MQVRDKGRMGQGRSCRVGAGANPFETHNLEFGGGGEGGGGGAGGTS
jgi:hypothetical protein